MKKCEKIVILSNQMWTRKKITFKWLNLFSHLFLLILFLDIDLFCNHIIRIKNNATVLIIFYCNSILDIKFTRRTNYPLYCFQDVVFELDDGTVQGHRCFFAARSEVMKNDAHFRFPWTPTKKGDSLSNSMLQILITNNKVKTNKYCNT